VRRQAPQRHHPLLVVALARESKETRASVLARDRERIGVVVERHGPGGAALGVPRAVRRERAQVPLGAHAVQTAAEESPFGE